MLIYIYSYLVLDLKFIHENMKKNQNNKFGYGIDGFPKNKMFLFHTPTKLNVL
jgi:hypothetical protein